MPIQLSADKVLTVSLGGVTIDTQDAIAASAVSSDLLGGVINVTFTRGTPASNSFTPSVKSGTVPSISINMTTGVWNSNGASGALTPPQLALLATNQKNLKNGIESLVNSLGLVSGMVIQWT